MAACTGQNARSAFLSVHQRRADGYPRSMLSPRNRELLGLVPSALLVTAGFTAIFIQAENNSPGASTNFTLNHASGVSLTYGALFLAL